MVVVRVDQYAYGARMSGRAARNKGIGWEREVAEMLRSRLGIAAKRGLTQPRGGSAEDPDVITPGWPLWLEAKRGKKTDARGALRQAVDAIGDAEVDAWPVAVCKDDHEAPVAMLPLELLLCLLLTWDRRAPSELGYAVAPTRKKPAPKPKAKRAPAETLELPVTSSSTEPR